MAVPSPDPAAVDAYIAAQPAPARSVLKRVRAILRKALPGATERISYRIPMFEIDGRMVLYLAGFQRHYSIYPASARLVRALTGELTGVLHNKATLRFPLDGPIPTRLIARIAKLRAAEAAELTAARAAARERPRRAARQARGARRRRAS